MSTVVMCNPGQYPPGNHGYHGSVQGEGLITEAESRHIERMLDGIPSDSELTERLTLLFEEFDSPQPDLERIDRLQRSQLQFVSDADNSVRTASEALSELIDRIGDRMPRDKHFFWKRYVRMMHQCLEHFRFDTGGEARDRHMAENILALRDLHPEARMAVTSGIGTFHATRSPSLGVRIT
ncbi:MAG: hypothetical protein R3C05_27330 [Pirellulaceae bacterium]